MQTAARVSGHILRNIKYQQNTGNVDVMPMTYMPTRLVSLLMPFGTFLVKELYVTSLQEKGEMKTRAHIHHL